MSEPPWSEKIRSQYLSGAANQFVIHGNVNDRLLLPATKRKAGSSAIGNLSDFLVEHQLRKFDIVLSYLSFVDIANLKAAASEITRVLRENGKLVIVTISNVASTTAGWVKDKNGHRTHREVDRYMEEFALDLEWRGIRIRNYHRPLSYTLGLFLDQGFVLTRFVEPLPDPAEPNYKDEHRVPTFQILALDRIADRPTRRGITKP